MPTYTITTEPDDISAADIEDPEVFGRYEFCYSHRDDRPSGFTGAAEKLHTQSDTVWWEPPADIVPLRNTDPSAFSKFREYVQDVLTYGYTVLVCTFDPEDGTGRTFSSVLGGCDPFPTMSDYADDLHHDAYYEYEQANARLLGVPHSYLYA